VFCFRGGVGGGLALARLGGRFRRAGAGRSSQPRLDSAGKSNERRGAGGLALAERLALAGGLALALAGPLAGCGPRFKSTGYLADYARVEFVGGNSDLAWERVAAGSDLLAFAGIYLARVQARPGVLGHNPELRDEIAEVLRGQLYVWLRDRY